MKAIPNYPYCFVCGDKNKIGLKVAFFYEDGKAKAQYTPTRDFEGYKDICHGGILSSLLDEVMIYSLIAQGIITVTVQIEVKFKKPTLHIPKFDMILAVLLLLASIGLVAWLNFSRDAALRKLNNDIAEAQRQLKELEKERKMVEDISISPMQNLNLAAWEEILSIFLPKIALTYAQNPLVNLGDFLSKIFSHLKNIKMHSN